MIVHSTPARAFSPPLRVLLVAASMDVVGGQSVQADFILQRLRDEPSLEMSFQPVNPRFMPALRSVQKVRYVRTLPTFSLYCTQLFKALQWCDIAHVFSASYFSFLLAPSPAIHLARRLGKPVLLNYHSGEAADHLARWPSAVRTLRLANRIVVPSGYLVDVFRDFGLNAHVVFNAVDLGAFKFRARDNPRPAFLANRNFESHYNVACVLRAFASIQRRRPDASLTVAGDGPQREPLRQLASELGLRNTLFVGQVRPERMPDLYDEHDVWLNASDVDNMPISILEAFACGLAVVSTDAGGIPHIVEDRRTGRLVRRGDSEALAQAALDVIADAGRFAELTRNGLAECGNYAWDKVKQGWLTTYFELGAGTPPAGPPGRTG